MKKNMKRKKENCELKEKEEALKKVISGTSRMEVISDKGREFVSYEAENDFQFSLQDGGKTLKIFVFLKT